MCVFHRDNVSHTIINNHIRTLIILDTILGEKISKTLRTLTKRHTMLPFETIIDKIKSAVLLDRGTQIRRSLIPAETFLVGKFDFYNFWRRAESKLLAFDFF